MGGKTQVKFTQQGGAREGEMGQASALLCHLLASVSTSTAGETETQRMVHQALMAQMLWDDAAGGGGGGGVGGGGGCCQNEADRC